MLFLFFGIVCLLNVLCFCCLFSVLMLGMCFLFLNWFSVLVLSSLIWLYLCLFYVVRNCAFLVLDCVPCFLNCCYCSGVLLFPLLCVRYCCSCSLLMFLVFEFVS